MQHGIGEYSDDSVVFVQQQNLLRELMNIELTKILCTINGVPLSITGKNLMIIQKIIRDFANKEIMSIHNSTRHGVEINKLEGDLK